MYLIEIFLPLTDNLGQPFPRRELDRVRAELTDRFGGVTAFLRAPATGLWDDDDGRIRHDELAILEVMAESLDRRWWTGYRERLEQQFRQEEIVVRATAIDRL